MCERAPRRLIECFLKLKTLIMSERPEWNCRQANHRLDCLADCLPVLFYRRKK